MLALIPAKARRRHRLKFTASVNNTVGFIIPEICNDYFTQVTMAQSINCSRCHQHHCSTTPVVNNTGGQQDGSSITPVVNNTGQKHRWSTTPVVNNNGGQQRQQ
jgi:hypothetical protein